MKLKSKIKTVKINKQTEDIIRERVFLTLGILLVIRMGTFLPVPGINPNDLAFYLQNHSVTRNLVSTFSGNDTFVIGLFTLNIFPYINASILMQLLIVLTPNLAKLQKEADLTGRRKINRLTRLLTLIFAIIQSISIAFYLKQVLFDWNYMLVIEIIFWLTTGAIIILWLSEMITDYGLGNGSSLLIYTNIVSNLPNFTKTIFFENSTDSNFLTKIICILLLFISLYAIVFLQEGFRSIPLISSKQLTQVSETGNYYLPLRFNQAGVMPIILTTTVLVVPTYISNLGLIPKIELPPEFDFLKFIYWIGYFGLILAFSLFYSIIVLNPKDISDQLQKMAVAIYGVRPGIQTTFYLKQVMKRIALIGAIILATIVIIPNFTESTLAVTNLNGLSSTSLLILAGVILDLIREIRNIYYSNVYTDRYS